MIVQTVLILVAMQGAETRLQARAPAQVEFDPVLFLDRLHQTFLLLNQVALPAYRDHFRDDPDQLAVVRRYERRLADTLSGKRPDRTSVDLDKPLGPDSPREMLMAASLLHLDEAQPEDADRYLAILGTGPHVELSRSDGTMPVAAARCVLYDPELVRAHGVLWQLKTKRAVPAVPSGLAPAIHKQHEVIRALRQRPGDTELSLRKFLDKHRREIWDLGWLYRCRGVELGTAPAARDAFLRAWAIGDALFPVSERGRIDRFDPTFLVELGDVYGRLGRYDLMLRYIYSDDGLPARHELAGPVAELVRVAESVRLANADTAAAVPLEMQLPETVSQILFDRAVPALPEVLAAGSGGTPARHSRRFGWILLATGSCILGAAIVWRLTRVARRQHRDW